MTLSFYLFFLAIFLVPTIGIMLSSVKNGPYKLFAKGLGLLIYIGGASYGMIQSGEMADSSFLKFSGSMIILVVSILTSVMISSAWTELRQQKLKEECSRK
jgi:hypothetical protein